MVAWRELSLSSMDMSHMLIERELVRQSLVAQLTLNLLPFFMNSSNVLLQVFSTAESSIANVTHHFPHVGVILNDVNSQLTTVLEFFVAQLASILCILCWHWIGNGDIVGLPVWWFFLEAWINRDGDLK